MTKKKRELIDILLDNVKPEDWPENLPFAAQDKDCCAIWFYKKQPELADGFDDRFSAMQDCKRFHYHPRELCKHWNKTIVHRDEFMKRWNDRNQVEVKTLTFSREGIDGFTVTECMDKISIKPDIELIISDRGINYGRFEDGAEIMQQLKLIAHTSQGWERMKPIQREGMDMILHKIGRILNGNPSYADSWIDIEGYSNLVSSWLKGTSK